MQQLERKLQIALQECERLKQENLKLKKILFQYNIPFPKKDHLENSRLKEEKIAARIKIFKNLFKGREDIFARQWQKGNGKVGYSPADNGKFHIPLTDQVIYDHLDGKRTIGIYPLLKDNTCWFLAVDFDKKTWQTDALAFHNVCKEMNIPASIERSRSGKGCHVWIFFDVAIPAVDARNLGSMLLTKTMEKRNQTGISSFDRFFPSQDTLSKRGFGNLIALPLQKLPRKNNNSVFVDEHFIPYPNQWKYLASIRKMNKSELESLLIKSSHEERKLVIKTETESNDEIPEKLEVVLKNGIHIQNKGLPSSFVNQLDQLATFSNPAFYRAQYQRLSTSKIPRLIKCADIFQKSIILPRGSLKDLKEICRENNTKLIIKGNTNPGRQIEAKFFGDLTAQQKDAVECLLQEKYGVLSATTGFGKTVVAAALISERKVNTLVIVHTKQLLEQWKVKLSRFLNMDTSDIGQIGGGRNTAKGLVDIATIQSLNYKGEVKDTIQGYGQIIVDECHHISAFSFETILKASDATYVCGLTATPTRKDGLHPIMTMQCGPIRYKVTAKELAKVQPFKRMLIPRKTSFKSKLDGTAKGAQNIYSEIVQDKKRNEMIFNDVLLEMEKGSTPLILTERIEHVEMLGNMFKGFVKNMIVLTGGMKKSEREAKLNKLQTIPDEEERLIIATGKYIGEGFDYPVLDTLFLTMPIAWKGTLEQYVGRLHRFHDKKEIVKVYDYIDAREDTLQRMFLKRKSGYKALGYMSENSNEKEEGVQMRLF